jgi:hypothetical protein
MVCGFRVHRGREGEPNGFTWQVHRDLIMCAHRRLNGPIVLVRNNLRTHLMPPVKEFIAANEDWPTAYHFSPYVPGLNPREGIRSLVIRPIGNLAVTNPDQLATAMKCSLGKTLYRPYLIDGRLAGTGLTMDG